jgi:hypothetical protein
MQIYSRWGSFYGVEGLEYLNVTTTCALTLNKISYICNKHDSVYFLMKDVITMISIVLNVL